MSKKTFIIILIIIVSLTLFLRYVKDPPRGEDSFEDRLDEPENREDEDVELSPDEDAFRFPESNTGGGRW